MLQRLALQAHPDLQVVHFKKNFQRDWVCLLSKSRLVIYAWTIDLAHEAHRGRAMATMYIALEAGIGVGAFFSGWLYGNEAGNFTLVFWLSAAFAFVSFLYLVLFVERRSQLN